MCALASHTLSHDFTGVPVSGAKAFCPLTCAAIRARLRTRAIQPTIRGSRHAEPYTRSMARNLIRFSGGEHAVVDQTTTPPNWTGFLTESPWEATPAAALSTYTLTPCTSMEDQNAIATAKILLTQ
jgi:hypothetical protein